MKPVRFFWGFLWFKEASPQVNLTSLLYSFSCVLWNLSTLACGNMNYSQPCLSSTTCSAYCFSVVLSLALGSFFFCIHRFVLSHRLKGNFFYRSLELSLYADVSSPVLFLQILAILPSWTLISNLGRLPGSVWISLFCTAAWKFLGNELEHL